MLEYLQGPIWFSDCETGELLTGIEIIDCDDILKQLNVTCANLYNSYYQFDVDSQPCVFNYQQEKADKDILLGLISKILLRLNELNDGSFYVEDLETARLQAL